MANDFSEDDNCKCLYKFEEGALGVDSKGSDTLTIYGTPVADTGDFREGLACVNFEESNPDILYRLDDDLTSGFPGKVGESNTTFSVTLWAKYEELHSTDIDFIIAKHGAGGNNHLRSWCIGIDKDDSKILIRWGYSSGWENYEYRIDHALTVNEWFHLGVVFDSSNNLCYARLYDENDSSTTTMTEAPAEALHSDEAGFYISGAQGYGYNYFDGRVDEVVIFTDVLTPTEIDAIRNGTYSGAGVKIPIMLHHYKQIGGL